MTEIPNLLYELRKWCRQATPAPWEVNTLDISRDSSQARMHFYVQMFDPSFRATVDHGECPPGVPAGDHLDQQMINAQFIAMTRGAVPRLLDILEAARDHVLKTSHEDDCECMSSNIFMIKCTCGYTRLLDLLAQAGVVPRDLEKIKGGEYEGL